MRPTGGAAVPTKGRAGALSMPGRAQTTMAQRRRTDIYAHTHTHTLAYNTVLFINTNGACGASRCPQHDRRYFLAVARAQQMRAYIADV